MEYGDSLDIFIGNNISNPEIIKKRRISDIVIDECVTGSYHGTSLESLSCGCAVLVGIDEDTRLALDELYSGGSAGKTFPVIRTMGNSIRGVCGALIANPEYLRHIKKGARAWMEKNYSEYWQTAKWISWVQKIISQKI